MVVYSFSIVLRTPRWAARRSDDMSKKIFSFELPSSGIASLFDPYRINVFAAKFDEPLEPLFASRRW